MSHCLSCFWGHSLGSTAVGVTPFAGDGGTLLPAVVACLMLPCNGPCSLHRPDIVPLCIGTALESRWQFRMCRPFDGLDWFGEDG